MEKTIELMHREFESSTGPTPQFREFTSTFKRELTRLLKGHATDIKFSVGHFEISGFFTTQRGIWYFNTGDLRGRALGDYMLVRSAKSYKDYTGGTNHWVSTKDSPTFAMGLFALVNEGTAPRYFPNYTISL
jgi:hypothetical protein